jgi:hypothetical protein
MQPRKAGANVSRQLPDRALHDVDARGRKKRKQQERGDAVGEAEGNSQRGRNEHLSRRSGGESGAEHDEPRPLLSPGSHRSVAELTAGHGLKTP